MEALRGPQRDWPIDMPRRQIGLHKLLKDSPIILDGAMGTELMKRGLPSGVAPETWVLERPEEIRAVHAACVEAGSELIFTCTFGASRLRLHASGLAQQVEKINQEAVRIARSAGGTNTLVGGSIGPVSAGVPIISIEPAREMRALFTEQARALSDAGIDLFVIETMTELPEALAAVEAVRAVASHVPVALFFSPRSTPDDPDGFSDARSFIEMFREEVDVIGANCGEGPGRIFGGVIELLCREANGVPIAAKPSAGLPARDETGTLVYPVTPASFAESIRKYSQMGARFLGGCCGTTPDHIRAAREALA